MNTGLYVHFFVQYDCIILFDDNRMYVLLYISHCCVQDGGYKTAMLCLAYSVMYFTSFVH